MIQLTPEQVAQFFHRSYTAVDGLWFIKAEDKYGFDAALEMDAEVWKVLPKIQARMLKSMVGCNGGIEALLECLTTRLSLESFVFEAGQTEDNSGFRIVIKKCPWQELLLKANRGQLSSKIGSLICGLEYSAWAAEFGDNIRFELKDGICKGAPCCTLQFSS